MEKLLTHKNRPVIFTTWTVNQIINIADMKGENLNMTPADILEALRFPVIQNDNISERCIIETVKEAHAILKGYSSPESSFLF